MYKNLERQREEKRIMAERRIKTTDDPRCGSVAGYFAHRRRKPKETPCKQCKAAWAKNRRDNRRTSK
jgi:hypothetical protein